MRDGSCSTWDYLWRWVGDRMTLGDNRQQTWQRRLTIGRLKWSWQQEIIAGLSVSEERPVAGISIKLKYLGIFFYFFYPWCLENAVWPTDQLLWTKYTQVHCDKLHLFSYRPRITVADFLVPIRQAPFPSN